MSQYNVVFVHEHVSNNQIVQEIEVVQLKEEEEEEQGARKRSHHL